MSSPWDDRVIALGGMFQTASLVQQLATTGHVSRQHLETAVNSLFNQSPEQTLDVFGSLLQLQTGLEQLHDILKRKNTNESNDIVRYVMGIVHLQKQLLKRPQMLDAISSRLQQSKNQAEAFEPAHDNVLASLADIYTSTISTFSFRIQVTGDYNYLQQARIGNQIRVLLFSGIRSAVLWRQVGGSRLQVIMKRKVILQTCEQLLQEAKKQLH